MGRSEPCAKAYQTGLESSSGLFFEMQKIGYREMRAYGLALYEDTNCLCVKDHGTILREVVINRERFSPDGKLVASASGNCTVIGIIESASTSSCSRSSRVCSVDGREASAAVKEIRNSEAPLAPRQVMAALLSRSHFFRLRHHYPLRCFWHSTLKWIMAAHQEAISCSSHLWLPRFQGSHFFPLRDDYQGRHFWYSTTKPIMVATFKEPI
jgi:hypothetical protein